MNIIIQPIMVEGLNAVCPLVLKTVFSNAA